MEFRKELESNSSPRIRKVAKKISDSNLAGYGPDLLNALRKEIEKPRAWQTQCQLIQAIGITHYNEATPFLKALLDKEFKSTIVYKQLGFSILILENISELQLDFLFDTFRSGNVLLMSGACSAVLYKKMEPSPSQIRKILEAVSPYTEDEGKIITPRCYIAAVAHLWPKPETENFLTACKMSTWPGLVEIAECALEGKESKLQLI